MNNSHHYLISRIDVMYGLFDFCTIRYTEERFKTLEEAIDFAKGRNYKIQEFNTYKEMLEYALELENSYKYMDLWEEKDLIERESLHTDEKVHLIHRKLGMSKYNNLTQTNNAKDKD